MLVVGQVAPHDDQVHGLLVLLVKLAHLLPGLIQDANPERFFPSDLEHRRLGFERVSPRGNRQPTRRVLRCGASTVPLMLCTHVG
jgi:hypothetical protein